MKYIYLSNQLALLEFEHTCCASDTNVMMFHLNQSFIQSVFLCLLIRPTSNKPGYAMKCKV